MPRGNPKLAVVIGPPGSRKRQEVVLFKKCPCFGTTLVLSSVEKPWIMESVEFAYAELVKLLPDFLAGFAVRKPYSPVSFVKLADLDKCLEDIDVINCIELYSFISRQCAEIAREKDKRLVVSVFETIPSLLLHKVPPFSQNVKKVLKQADVFFAYSNMSAEYLRQLGAPEEKIKVIYPGVNMQRFYPQKERNHENMRILFVGGFAGEKGLEILLKTFSRLHTDVPQVEVWVCAKPRGREEEILIRAFMREYPLRAFGYVEHNEMPRMYRECDLFCLPSFDKRKWGMRVWEEQFGFALVEAMASGLPVVATDCGVVPEIVGSENGIVPQKSVEALYTALHKLVKDEDRRLYLAKVNRNRAERLFNIEKQRVIMGNVLNELL